MTSRAARTALLVVAAAALAVAFVVLRPDADDERAAPPAGGGEPGASAPSPATTAAEEPPPAGTTGGIPAPAPRVPAVRVRDGAVVGDPLRLEARTGEEVVLRVSSDAPDEVHVHGYDLDVDVAPGAPATVRFDAELEGVFEVELHEAGVELAQVRVSPS